jgi:collagenase-like PrtC family protease
MEYLDKVIELNSKYKDIVQVKSLFGSFVGLTPTARSNDRLPHIGNIERVDFIKKATNNGIAIRYTLNASCFGSLQDFRRKWDVTLRDDITYIHNLGIHEWTITSPLLLMKLREMFPNDFLEVSTIAEVSTRMDADRWKKLGANGVNVSTNINRNFSMIKGVKMTGLEVSILANEACLFRCPYRRECYNLSSHNSRRSEELFDFYPFRFCNNIRMSNLSEWLKSRMVLPQWMKVYQERIKVDWFKIAYRTHPYSTAVPILEAYMSQYHGGNYLDLWPTISHLGQTTEPKSTQYISCKGLDEAKFIEEMASRGSSCENSICGESCTYCDDVLKKWAQ